MLLLALALPGCAAASSPRRSAEVYRTLRGGDVVRVGTRTLDVPTGWSGRVMTRSATGDPRLNWTLDPGQPARVELVPADRSVGAVLTVWDRSDSPTSEVSVFFAKGSLPLLPALSKFGPGVRTLEVVRGSAFIALIPDGRYDITLEVGSNSTTATQAVLTRDLGVLAGHLR